MKELIDYVDHAYLSWGGGKSELYGTDCAAIKELQRRAAAADLKLLPAKIRHLGTENCFQILAKMYHQLGKKKWRFAPTRKWRRLWRKMVL